MKIYKPWDYDLLDIDNFTEEVNRGQGQFAVRERQLTFDTVVLPICSRGAVKSRFVTQLCEKIGGLKADLKELRLNSRWESEKEKFCKGYVGINSMYIASPCWQCVYVATIPVKDDPKDVIQYEWIEEGLKKLNDRINRSGSNYRKIFFPTQCFSEGVDSKIVFELADRILSDENRTIVIPRATGEGYEDQEGQEYIG